MSVKMEGHNMDGVGGTGQVGERSQTIEFERPIKIQMAISTARRWMCKLEVRAKNIDLNHQNRRTVKAQSDQMPKMKSWRISRGQKNQELTGFHNNNNK